MAKLFLFLSSILIIGEKTAITCTASIECKLDHVNSLYDGSVDELNLFCHQFSSWRELTALAYAPRITSYASCQPNPIVVLHPSTPLILTQELHIEHLAFLCNWNGDSARLRGALVKLFDFRGVNVYPWPVLTESGYDSVQLANSLYLIISTVEFYVNGTSDYECNADLIAVNDSATSLFESTFTGGLFIQENSRYSSRPVCPHLFRNAFLTQVVFSGLVSSFLYVNMLQFESSENTLTINSQVIEVGFGGYNYALDERLLHPLVFEKVNTVFFKNSIASIQLDLFKHFQQLTQVIIASLLRKND
jgi:hypothetical protein